MTQSRRVNKKHPHYYEASDGSMPEDFTLTRFNRRSFHKSTSRRKKRNSCEVEDANENFLNLADYENFLAESAERNRPNRMEESAEECNILKTILEVQPDDEPQSINALEILKEKAQEPILIPSRAWDEEEMIRFIDKVRSKLEMRRSKTGEKVDSKVSQTLTNKIQYFDKVLPASDVASKKLSPMPAAPEPVVVAPVIMRLEAGIQCNRAANDKMTQVSADREVQTENKKEVATETSSLSKELPSTGSVLNFKPKPSPKWSSSSSDEDAAWSNSRQQKKTKKTDSSSSSTASFLAYMLQTKKESSDDLRKRSNSAQSEFGKMDKILLQRKKSPKPNREVPDEIAAKLLRTESRRPPRRTRCSPPPVEQPYPKKERPRVRASLSSIDWMKQYKGTKKKKSRKSTTKFKGDDRDVPLEGSRHPRVMPSKVSGQTCHSRDYCSASSGPDSPHYSIKKKKKSKKVLVHDEHCPLYHSRRKKTSLTHAKVKTTASSPMQSHNHRKSQNPRPKSTPIKKVDAPSPVNSKKTNVGFLGRVAWFKDRLSEMIS